MSTSPSTFDHPRGPHRRPFTPDSTTPTIARTGSFSVAPKSEYLRNALQARRAQNTPTPSRLESRRLPPSSSKSAAIRTPDSSPDSFAEFALTEEQTAPVSPIHRRRPSDVGPPRSKTNRELTVEIEKLKDSLMTSNMRVELLRKSNSELQHNLTKAKERIELLEPLEEENYELEEENHHVRLKLEHVEKEVERLANANNALRSSNEELLDSNQQLGALSKQNAELWQSQESALDEAVMYIIRLEEDKTLLATEIKALKERVGALEIVVPSDMLVDGAGRYPLRMISVDESRPTTSHFDSDYYSQPDSPHAKPETASVISFAPSERSQKFLDLTEDRRKSARELVKRMSAASFAALTLRSPSPPPAVPQIPLAFQEQQDQGPQSDGQAKTESAPEALEPQDNGQPRTESAPKVPGRFRQGRHAVPQDLLNEALHSPTRAEPQHQPDPMPRTAGLRGLYNPDRVMRSKTYHKSSSRSKHSMNSIDLGSTTYRAAPMAEPSLRVPSRASSRYAHTSSSSEHMTRPNTHQISTDLGMRLSSDSIQVDEQQPAPYRTSTAPPPSNLTLSTSDLTLEYDPREDKDRWWRNMEKITSSPVRIQPRTALGQAAPLSSLAQDHTRKLRSIPSLETLRVSDRKSSTAPSTPQEERDFIFNPAETVETFMRKAKNKISSSRRLP